MHWALPRRCPWLSTSLHSTLLPTVSKRAAEMPETSCCRGPWNGSVKCGPILGGEWEMGRPGGTPARHSSEGSPAPLSSHILVTYVHLHRCALSVESTQVAGQGLEHCVHILHVQALSFQILGMEKFDWIWNSFPLSQEISTSTSVKENKKEELLHSLKIISTVVNFWMAVKNGFKFFITYLCEQSFSSMVTIKNLKRSLKRLDQDLLVAISNIKLGIKQLCAWKQAQLSY